ncbi:lysine decarboxylase [Desulfocucumis palustris]|uniref:Lysine decarboxylase n=1 Tax=Desulfocucumis palustris TaxID=1898651 RepID=A0A2L2XKD4_9FIRM|nr:decarboxylase [Desulfocucumis palustris]GBF34371.1 lysine decarboxylase [Desulfocucumis palustris]
MSLNQKETPLLGAMLKIAAGNAGRFHVPGHGGTSVPPELLAALGPGLFRADLTELPGLDDLSSPSGVIEYAQQLAADAFGADSTFFLLNGSTLGLQSLVAACCPPGSKIILPRNIHRSLLGGLIISGAQPVFLNPGLVPDFNFASGLSRETVRRGLADHPGARVLLLIHPSYYGVTGDTASHAEAAHEAGIPVIADEAHGAHLRFHPGLPEDSLSLGADASVQSMHKTGGSLTQTALLHLKGGRLDRGRVAGTLALLQTSSPSYPLMASLDASRKRLLMEGDLFGRSLELALALREKLIKIKGIEVFGSEHVDGDAVYGFDPLRVVVSVRKAGLTGYQAAGRLARRGLFVEMADQQNLVLVIGLGVDAVHCENLLQALKEAVENNSRNGKRAPGFGMAPSAAARMSPREAWFAPSRNVRLPQAAGKVSAEWVAVFPPGIPALIPGEEISPEMIEFLTAVRAAGAHVQGPCDSSLVFLRVVDE